jgi:hypothetical protein
MINEITGAFSRMLISRVKCSSRRKSVLVSLYPPYVNLFGTELGPPQWEAGE